MSLLLLFGGASGGAPPPPPPPPVSVSAGRALRAYAPWVIPMATWKPKDEEDEDEWARLIALLLD